MFSSGAMKSKVDLLDASRMLLRRDIRFTLRQVPRTFLNTHGVSLPSCVLADERADAENNVMTMIAEHKFDLIVNIPKNHSKRELTNGYRFVGAIDLNIR